MQGRGYGVTRNDTVGQGCLSDLVAYWAVVVTLQRVRVHGERNEVANKQRIKKKKETSEIIRLAVKFVYVSFLREWELPEQFGQLNS